MRFLEVGRPMGVGHACSMSSPQSSSWSSPNVSFTCTRVTLFPSDVLRSPVVSSRPIPNAVLGLNRVSTTSVNPSNQPDLPCTPSRILACESASPILLIWQKAESREIANRVLPVTPTPMYLPGSDVLLCCCVVVPQGVYTWGALG